MVHQVVLDAHLRGGVRGAEPDTTAARAAGGLHPRVRRDDRGVPGGVCASRGGERVPERGGVWSGLRSGMGFCRRSRWCVRRIRFI